MLGRFFNQLTKAVQARRVAKFNAFNKDPVVLPTPASRYSANADGSYTCRVGKESLVVDAQTYQQGLKAESELFGANVVPATAEETLAQRKLEYYILQKKFTAVHAGVFCAWWGWTHRPAAYEQPVIPSKFDYIASRRRGLYQYADNYDEDIPIKLYDPETFNKAPEHHPPYLPLYTYEFTDVNV